MSNIKISFTDFYQAYKSLKPGEVVLDVRRPDEFEAAHIPKAINIPVDQVQDRAEELKKYDRVYVHCKRGGRAQKAFETLSNAGLENLACIYDGGMDHWLESGYPADKG